MTSPMRPWPVGYSVLSLFRCRPVKYYAVLFMVTSQTAHPDSNRPAVHAFLRLWTVAVGLSVSFAVAGPFTGLTGSHNGAADLA
jgi:hypothetical protein